MSAESLKKKRVALGGLRVAIAALRDPGGPHPHLLEPGERISQIADELAHSIESLVVDCAWCGRGQVVQLPVGALGVPTEVLCGNCTEDHQPKVMATK